ncbi:hypothetical protein [Halobaculum sp. D14]|uniref:hypothetical protein n=1 Tax=unclassified Halobaculum TaxID=2640896 RepID=UPI003EBB8AD5
MPSNGARTVGSVALVALLLVVAAASTPAAARAPPQPACDVCGERLTATAAEHGVDVAVGHAAVTVQVYENASTRWTARVELTDGADALRNDTVRGAVIEDVVGYRVDRFAVSSRMDGETLVVTYLRRDAAVRSAGAVVFTAFHASSPPPLAMGGEGTVYPGADELVVHAPDGYVVAGGIGDGNATQSAVRWAGENGGDDGIDRDTAVTFVPDGAVAPGLRGVVARLLR